MSINDNSMHEITQKESENQVKVRRQYHKPRLEDLGDLRTLTLGGSPGLNDSGSQFTRRPPGATQMLDNLPPPGLMQ